MKASLITLALLLGHCFATAQSFQVPTRSGPDYIYRITSEEARYLQDHQLKSTDTAFFHDLVGVFDNFKNTAGIPPGHYIQVNTSESRFNYTYTPMPPWHIYMLDNATDFIVQLTDKNDGTPLSSAILHIDQTPVPFDPETSCYKIDKANKDGILTVHYKDYTFYYTINKSRNSSVLYSLGRFSQRYLLQPACFLACLPVDGVRSIGKKKAQGGILSLKQAIHRVKVSFTSQKEALKDKDKQEMEEEFKSYFFFSKPKYREGDTIQFKAHIVDQKTRQWVNDELWITLNDGLDEYYYLEKMKPGRPGDGYDFQFVIQDSMDLDLDDKYDIELKNADSITIAWGTFIYEDYELKKAVFTTELLQEDEKHFKGKPFEVKLTAKDENKLPVRDTRVDLYVTLRWISAVKPDTLFVPDTLWHYSTTVEDGEKLVQIPDSIFPDANVSYLLHSVMRNSEQEIEERDFYVSFLNDTREIETLPEDEAIVFRSKAGVIKDKVHLYATDRFAIRVLDTSVYLPFSVPLNTHVHKYFCGKSAEVNMDDLNSEIWLRISRTTDSVFINLVNPRKLPVVYHLYKNEKEVARGAGKTFGIRRPAAEKDNYHIIVEYIWAGKAESKTQAITLSKSIVMLNVQQPPVVYPGKETEISITATDYKHDPVPGMNILAYSFTDKFNDYTEPSLPYMGTYTKGKKVVNKFRITKSATYQGADTLDFPYWNKVMHLDTNWYYRFLFPQKAVIEYFHLPQEDSITQVAPFITDNGIIQPVYYVLKDGVPVYFGFTDSKVPYSFGTDTMMHQFKIRTPRRLITVNYEQPMRYHKTVFAIDPSLRYLNVVVEPYPDTLTVAEQTFLSSYVMGFSTDYSAPKYAYIKDGWEHIHALSTDLSRYHQKPFRTHGPVTRKYWNYRALNDFSVYFEFEPFYHYSFKPELVKMKSTDGLSLFPSGSQWPVPSLKDEVLTEQRFVEDYLQMIRRNRLAETPRNVFDTIRGEARLMIEIGNSRSSGSSPQNIILFKPGDFSFIKIFPGTTRSFHNLPQGKYELLLVDSNSIYRKTGILSVKNNGQNFYRFEKIDTFKGKSLGPVDSLLFRVYQSLDNTAAITQVMNAYFRGTYTGPIRTIKGKVSDERGEGIPGISLTLEETAIGTVTDIDGNFDLMIPLTVAHPLLYIRGLGFLPQSVVITGDELMIMMSSSDTEIDEVSIYGQKVDKRSYTGALTTVTAFDIAKRPITDFVVALEGGVAGVSISQAGPGEDMEVIIQGRSGGEADSNVLVVIDGAIYSGGLASLDPDIMESLVVLKDATATSIYGARGAKGVVLITTKKGARLSENIRKGLEPPAMPEALMVSSLRSHFRDDAYWQPNLRTDENGKATFKVTFPDDITAWKTFVLATDAQKHTGQANGLIKSYKPLSASLLMPAFLVQGDTAQLLGKSVSYVPDTISATTSYFEEGLLAAERKIRLSQFHNDTLQLIAGQVDSISLKYMLRKDDGYFDGEEKTMPVLPKGVLVAVGAFLPLDRADTSFTLPEIKAGDTLHLSAMASLLDIVDDEIRIVGEYEHLCNEQLASKIIASLNRQRIAKALQRPFDDKSKVQEMIDKLLQRQNTGRLWGWWENGETVYWISNHVTHALLEAKSQQYRTGNINFETILQPLLFKWQTDTTYTDIQSLKLLHQAGIKANYEQFISRLERKKDIPLSQRLSLMLMRRQAGLPCNRALLLSSQKEDIFGNRYWKDSSNTIYENELLTTLTALKIVQADSTLPIPRNKVINWLLQQRGAGGWRNIYESAQIIEAIVKDLPLGNKAAMQPQLSIICGDRRETVTQFPYRKRLTAGEPVTVSKQGISPVYFTWYRQYRDTTNKDLGKNFVVSSSFAEKGAGIAQLHAGVPVTMNVSIAVKKSAEFVMIEIPIPAGCSYNDKSQAYDGYEVHREYRKNKVSIFCERLPEGTHHYSLQLLPRFSGTYTVNPAKAELMYFPVFYGRSAIKTINIR